MTTIEYYIISQSTQTTDSSSNLKTVQSCNVNISKEMFDNILEHVSVNKTFPKPFCKKYKVSVYQNMFYEVYDNNEIKTYSKDIESLNIMEPFLKVKCHKEKTPFHLFPCTTSLHNTYCVSKLSFRLHNRVFLNFIQQNNYDSNMIIYKILLNYNHDINIEQDIIDSILNNTLKFIQKALS